MRGADCGTTTLEYAYSTTTGLLTSLNANLVGTSIPVAYTYQGANQLRSKAIGSVMTKAYNFGTSSGYRTALPNFVNYRDPDGNLIYGDYCVYDGNGRIVSIADSGNTSSVRATYGYDEQGQLTSAAVGGTRYAYTYDMAGVRSSKTVGSTTYKYTTLSGLVTRQTGGNATIDFVYDESNQPLAMKYNNTLYYYVLNAQGDVVRIINSSRSVVASYTYDPWGKIISSSGTLADINPLRYRGYYYDSETGFYYLQSRYYDPEIGRFINADSYASTDATGLLSTNMFAYCENDPVNKSDPTGEVAPILIAMAGGALVGIAEQFMTDVIYAMVTGQPLDACFSSVGTYVSSAVGGAMSVLPGGGVMRACVEIVGLSYIQTGVDLIFESKIEKTEDPSGRVLIDSAKGGLSKAAEAKSKTITAKIAKSSMGKSKIGKATGAIIGAIGKYFGNIMDLAERSIKHWWRGD